VVATGEATGVTATGAVKTGGATGTIPTGAPKKWNVFLRNKFGIVKGDITYQELAKKQSNSLPTAQCLRCRSQTLRSEKLKSFQM
jgi:hypothetical protein